MRHSILPLLILPLACVPKKEAPGAGTQDAANWENQASRFGSGLVRKLSSLPKQGKLDREPWSETYWPNREAGIAVRWQSAGSNAYLYEPHPLASLKRMSKADIGKLSPAEKYDIYMGRYDYPTVKRERSCKPATSAEWEGICHAWTPAALHFAEPGPVEVTSRDGLVIPFGASDIKGLLTAAFDFAGSYPDYHRIGLRCEEERSRTGRGSQDPCLDVNAGEFHILMTNHIGKGKRGFIIDADRRNQVWNQPVYAFETREIGRRQRASASAAPGTVEEVTMETRLTWIAELEPSWEPHLRNGNNARKTSAYRYRLELDRNGEIIGGEWETSEDWDRPDFVWMAGMPNLSKPLTDSRTGETFDLSGILRIYQAAMKGTGTTEPTVPTPDPEPKPASCEALKNYAKCFYAWPQCRWSQASQSCSGTGR